MILNYFFIYFQFFFKSDFDFKKFDFRSNVAREEEEEEIGFSDSSSSVGRLQDSFNYSFSSDEESLDEQNQIFSNSFDENGCRLNVKDDDKACDNNDDNQNMSMDDSETESEDINPIAPVELPDVKSSPPSTGIHLIQCFSVFFDFFDFFFQFFSVFFKFFNFFHSL